MLSVDGAGGWFGGAARTVAERGYPLGAGRTRSSSDLVGGGMARLASSRAKQLVPASDQRRISSITLDSVKVERCWRSDSSTLTTTVRRRAPRSVLLVRPVLRASAALRSVRSPSLFVPGTGTTSPVGVSTGAAVTNVKSYSASISRINSLASSRWSLAGPSDGGSSANHIDPHNLRISSSSVVTFSARPASPSRRSHCTRHAWR